MEPSLEYIWSLLLTILSPTASEEDRNRALSELAELDRQALWEMQKQPAWQGLLTTLETPPPEREPWMNVDEEDPEEFDDPPMTDRTNFVKRGTLAASAEALRTWMTWDISSKALPSRPPHPEADWIERIRTLGSVQPAMPLPTYSYGARLFWGHLDLSEAAYRLVTQFDGPHGAIEQFYAELEREDRLKALPVPLARAWGEHLRKATPHQQDLVAAACEWIGDAVASRVTVWLDEAAIRDTHAALQVQLAQWVRLLEITNSTFTALARQTITALVLRQIALQDQDSLRARAEGDLSRIAAIMKEDLESDDTSRAPRFEAGLTGVSLEVPREFWLNLSAADREAVLFLTAGD